MFMNEKAFTGLQMHSLQGGSLLFHYSAGPSMPCWFGFPMHAATLPFVNQFCYCV